jgi:cytochrome c-type biogenesis protein CcmH/NrfG
MKNRPYLLHKIILRKNPNNIKHWISLSRLYAVDDKSDE